MEGIMYVATGKKYENEVKEAIKRVRNVMPAVPIALYTDLSDIHTDVEYLYKIDNPQYHFGDKVNAFARTPFDKTIFLDTDTYLVDSIQELFLLLDRFDILAPHAPIDDYEFVDIPNCFVEMNSGVIAYRKNQRTLKMFQLYENHYRESVMYSMAKYNDIPPDQPSFRYAVYNSDVDFCFLPHEYNCMLDFPCFLSGQVHILHGHYDMMQMQHKEKLINSSIKNRLYDPQKGII